MFLEQATSRNRTLNGDEVVIKINPEDQWKSLQEDSSSELSKKMSDLELENQTTGESNGLWDCQFDTAPPSSSSSTTSTKNVTEERAIKLKKQPTATVVAVKAFGTSWTSEHMGRLEMRRKGDSYAKFRPTSFIASLSKSTPKTCFFHPFLSIQNYLLHSHQVLYKLLPHSSSLHFPHVQRNCEFESLHL